MFPAGSFAASTHALVVLEVSGHLFVCLEPGMDYGSFRGIYFVAAGAFRAYGFLTGVGACMLFSEP